MADACHHVNAWHSAGVVKGLVEVVRSAQKEKVVRVALLALRNLLAEQQLDLAADMVDAGLPKALAMRAMQVRGKVPPLP